MPHTLKFRFILCFENIQKLHRIVYTQKIKDNNKSYQN